jgi:hypothetical protein
MNSLLLHPSDVLFFRDGRPMSGSLSGAGAAWPLPTVTNAALHAALWRAGLAGQSHEHFDDKVAKTGSQRFGSLVTAGPFPVCTNGAANTWFFPAPADASCTPAGKPGDPSAISTILQPVSQSWIPGSSGSNPLPFTAASTKPPSKDKLPAWWSEGAWCDYLGTRASDDLAARRFVKSDSDFSDSEHTIGIGISPETGAQNEKQFYSASYLRLRPGWALGLLAETHEKYEERGKRKDLVQELFPQDGTLIVGGQQRVCRVAIHARAGTRLPLPEGRRTGFPSSDLGPLGTCHLVKWVLLSPAIWPEIPGDPVKGIRSHPGGWLPSWIDKEHRVQLRIPLPKRDPAKQSREEYRKCVREQERIDARLVCALVPKPVPVTGWGLEIPGADGDEVRRKSGARPVHLAVPAGAVYYFACADATAAEHLAAALNWHGAGDATAIRNRRSTLFGEKGFGIGVCTTWTPYSQS